MRESLTLSRADVLQRVVSCNPDRVLLSLWYLSSNRLVYTSMLVPCKRKLMKIRIRLGSHCINI